MRTKINLTRIDENDTEKVIVLTKDLNGMTLYEQTKQQQSFVKNDTKQLEYCVDNVIREFLQEFGLFIKDNSKSEYERVFSTLKTCFGKRITIKDLYSNVDEKVVDTSNGRTTIIDKYNVIQCAVSVRLESVA